MRLHASNPNLSTIDFGEEKVYSNGSETSSEFSKMQEDLCHIAHKGKWDLICIDGNKNRKFYCYWCTETIHLSKMQVTEAQNSNLSIQPLKMFEQD